MSKKVVFYGLVIALAIPFGATSLAKTGGKIVSHAAAISPYTWDGYENNYIVHIKATVTGHDSDDWVGCSVGDTDLPAKPIGTSRETIEWDTRGNTGDNYTIALWDGQYNSGEGPEPQNSWGRKNGYYMSGELDRVEGKVGVTY